MKLPSFPRAGLIWAACSGLTVTASAQYYTAPTGPGGTWNLYEVTNAVATWKNAHLAAIARQAGATGVSGVTGSNQTGHLIAINTWQENSMASFMAIRHTNSSNVWIGLTDSDDADLGGAGWADAASSTTSGQWFWAGTTGGSATNGALRLTETGHNAFYPGEPNNSTGAQTQGEDAVELRTDGRWNDNAHTAAATTRRYIIEWDINAAAPIAGATVIPPVYTAPYGDGGKWNLYMMVGEADTWLHAHNRATTTNASATGLAAMAGNTTKGHLLEVSSRIENSFAVALSNRLLRNTNLIADNDALTNQWIGLTDNDDLGFAEAGTAKGTGWYWAGTSGGTGPGGARHIEDSFDYPNTDPIDDKLSALWSPAEPNDAANTNYPFNEDAVELRGNGHWYDLFHKTGINNAATTARRYIIEWPLNANAPIAGAETNGFYFTAQHGTGNTWNLYFLDYTLSTWTNTVERMRKAAGLASYTGVPSLAASTVRGHLIEIADFQEHGSVYRMTNGLGTWLGLTDDPNYGGQESGNASNNPTNQINPFWVWADANSSADYRRWNAGEPNNSGGVEHAGEMTANGGFNDNRQNLSTTIRRSLLEWPVQSATPIAGVQQVEPIFAGTRTLTNTPAVGTWAIKSLSGVTMTGLRSAARATLDGATNGTVVETTSPVINFNDRSVATPNAINFPGFGDVGLFAGDLPLPNDTVGADNDQYVMFARTKITVTTAGDYTFNVHADDTAALRIVGQPFNQVFAPGFIDTLPGDTIYNAVGSGDSNTRGVVTLAAGTYDVELLTYESTSGSSCEVSWSPGVHATDESPTATWSLVGNPAAAYPQPLLPAVIANAPAPGNQEWGIHTVSGAGQLNTLTDAINALTGAAGNHATAAAPVINHSDPSFAGTGGMFPGEFTLPSDTPGTPTDDNDFAMHAHAEIEITNPGLYTFGAKHSENIALRIQGGKWLNVGGDFGIDPVDPSTVYTIRNSLNNINTTELTSRAVIALEPGKYKVDFIAFDRDGAFFTELYSRTELGSFVNTAEYVTGTEGATVTMAGTYRLVGYQADPVDGVGVLGVDVWTRACTTPTTSTTAPANWGGTTVAFHDVWFDTPANGGAAGSDTQTTINERDPQSPTTAGGLPNDRPFLKNTTGDDNYYVERFTANLYVPRAGTYSIGWQGDDGGYIQVENLPAGVHFERIEASATPGSNLSIVDIPGAPAGSGIRARLQNQLGGGNTKTMARLTFPDDGSIGYPAQFPIRSQHFEGTGGSYWEIFAGVSSSYGRPLLLLEAGASNAVAGDTSGIALAAAAVSGEIRVTNVQLTAGNLLSFTFDSENGRSYRIERSTVLNDEPWASVQTITASGSSTTWTQPSATLPGQPRYFYRARLLP